MNATESRGKRPKSRFVDENGKSRDLFQENGKRRDIVRTAINKSP